MRGEQDFRPTELHILFKKGGLGDTIARLPAVKYILEEYAHVTKVRLFVQDYAVELCVHLLNDRRCDVYGYKDMPAILEQYPDVPGMSTDSEHHTTLRTHLTDHAFHTLVDTTVSDFHKNYLKLRLDEIDACVPAILLFNKYIVITTGHTAQVREMLPQIVNELVAWIILQGFTPVFLGKKENEFWAGKQPSSKTEFSDEIDYTVGIDMRDKTNLLQAGLVMANAAAVVGLDNGLLHLAACSDVKIVAGYTSVSPKHRMPYRNSELGYNVRDVSPEDLACKFCQTQGGFVYKNDWRNCYYGDYKCTKELTADYYKMALVEVLNS
jgi:hypothetical protein